MIVVLFLLLAQSLMAQSLVFPGPGIGGSGSGGGMGAWTLVNHIAVPGVGNDSNVATPNINCTGANLYVVATMSYNAHAAGARYDPGDGGHDITNNTGWAISPANVNVGLFWADGITGTASVSFSAHNNYGFVLASCWAGAAASSAKDQESASGASACYPCSPSLTPGQDGTLALLFGDEDSAAAGGVSMTAAGFTALDKQSDVAGASWGGAIFYRIFGAGTSGVSQSVAVTSSAAAGAVKMVNFKHP